jgi:hypothetical protein
MKKNLLLFLIALGFVAFVPQKSKAGGYFGITIGPGYCDPIRYITEATIRNTIVITITTITHTVTGTRTINVITATGTKKMMMISLKSF